MGGAKDERRKTKDQTTNEGEGGWKERGQPSPCLLLLYALGKTAGRVCRGQTNARASQFFAATRMRCWLRLRIERQLRFPPTTQPLTKRLERHQTTCVHSPQPNHTQATSIDQKIKQNKKIKSEKSEKRERREKSENWRSCSLRLRIRREIVVRNRGS